MIRIFVTRLDISGTGALYEYVNARITGENIGQCDQAYPQCPFSVFNIIHGGHMMP